jgi:hypothetical protein
MKIDAEMVQLATQLIERQAGTYDPADAEDRYEIRLRELIDARMKGEGFEAEAEEKPEQTNVIDLMGALRRSLGQSEPAPAKSAAAKRASAAKKPGKGLSPEEKRRQPAFKLPIEGGKKSDQEDDKAAKGAGDTAADLGRRSAEKKTAPSGRAPSRKSA